MDDAWRVKPPPAGRGAELRVMSPDGRWRAVLYPTGRTQVDARGRVRPHYYAVIVRCADGAVVADTRRSGEEAWLLDADGLTMELARPAETQTHVYVDLREGVCYLENFREPLSETRGLERLGEFLGG
jgi:hypothetical protein